MSALIYFIITIVCIAIGYVGYHVYCNYYWKNRKLDNFPFMHKGKLFWYSRSCATTLFVFCKDQDGVLHVLANKRGSGVPDYKGFWNAPCGYLQFDMSGEENAQTEVWEETGIFVPQSHIKFWKVVSDPSQNKQNVALKYWAMLDGICESYTFSTDNMEDEEVEEIAWVPMDAVDSLRWAFHHDIDIHELANIVTH